MPHSCQIINVSEKKKIIQHNINKKTIPIKLNSTKVLLIQKTKQTKKLQKNIRETSQALKVKNTNLFTLFNKICVKNINSIQQYLCK